MAKIKITKGELKSLIKEAMALDKGLLTESKSKKIQTHPLYAIIKEELTKVKSAQSNKSTKAKPVAKQTKTGQVAKKVQSSVKKPLTEQAKKQKINEGIKDVIIGSMMALASALGGEVVQAQTQVPLPIADTIVISGFKPSDVKVMKNAERGNMSMVVQNNISGAEINPETKQILDRTMGAIVKDEGTSVTITQNSKLKAIKTSSGVAQNNQTLMLKIHPNTKVTFQNDETQGISFQEGKKTVKKHLTEAQLNEDVKSWVLGGMMALASLFGGKANAQTSGTIKPLEKVSVLSLVGYEKSDVSITKVKGSRITYRVINDLQGGTIDSGTEKVIENMMGVAVPESKLDSATNTYMVKSPTIQIVAGDYEGEGALFSRIQNKFGNAVTSNQRIEIQVGEDAMNPDFKWQVTMTK